MNKQELVKKYEETIYAIIATDEVLEDLKQLDEPQKVTVPQIVADYIKYAKTTEWDLLEAMKNVPYEDNADFRKWFYKDNNVEVFARAWLDGYTVEKERRYEVILGNGQSLKTVYRQGDDHLDFEKVYGDLERFTRKQLEEAGFGWVFDCPGIEIEEVEE